MVTDNANYTLSVIIPALNEVKNIPRAILDTLTAFRDFNVRAEIIVINDGSSDGTGEITRGIIKNSGNISLIEHRAPLGIGACFWEGVDRARGDLLCMIPADNENPASEIIQYLGLLDQADMVIPYARNKQARSLLRNTLSWIYLSLINATFRTGFKYTNGTVLYKKDALSGVRQRNKTFFFQTDILIRLARQGKSYQQVPYSLGKRTSGSSKAVTVSGIIQVIKGYFSLVKDIYGARQTGINPR